MLIIFVMQFKIFQVCIWHENEEKVFSFLTYHSFKRSCLEQVTARKTILEAKSFVIFLPGDDTAQHTRFW